MIRASPGTTTLGSEVLVAQKNSRQGSLTLDEYPGGCQPTLVIDPKADKG